jgi:hypothetical protein
MIRLEAYDSACWRQVKAAGFRYQGSFMNFASRLAAVALAALLVGWSLPASAQSVEPAPPPPNLPPA